MWLIEYGNGRWSGTVRTHSEDRALAIADRLEAEGNLEIVVRGPDGRIEHSIPAKGKARPVGVGDGAGSRAEDPLGVSASGPFGIDAVLPIA